MPGVAVCAIAHVAMEKMDTEFDVRFHACIREVAAQPEVFVLQIGAGDGVQGDYLHVHLRQHSWKALLLEPVRRILVEDHCGEPIQTGIRLREFYEGLFGEPGPEYFVSHAAACFAVSRENVRQRPRSFYERALQLVLNRRMGPWEIERLWQYVFRTRVVQQGIVSAADAQFFRELQLLVRSHSQKDQFPMVVIDLGMYPEQRQWCLDAGVGLQSLPPIYKPVERIKQCFWWQAWLKPFYIFHAPFDRLLWIDADCVIAGDLAPAFKLIEEAPLMVRDSTAVETRNSMRLYDHLRLPSGINFEKVRVNSGVVGLCKLRDHALLSTWAYGVAWAALNPDKQHLSAWADQGMLLWAALKTGASTVIQESLEWNCQARVNRNLLASAVRDGCSIMETIRRQHPNAAIVHWLGPNKLSKLLVEELEYLFSSGCGGNEGKYK